MIAVRATITVPGGGTVNSLTTSGAVTLLATGAFMVSNAATSGSGATGVNAGTLRASTGGMLQVSGTEVNRGTLDAGSGTLVLSAATIEGGTVAATDGGTIIATGGVALDGTAALEALLAGAVVTASNGQTLSLLGTLASAGEITFAPYNGASTLLVAGATSLTGTGSLVLVRGSYAGSGITAAAAADTLTNVSETITGIGQLRGGLLAFTNDALVEATGNGTLELHTRTLATTNAGTLEGNVGTLQVNGLVVNAGTVAAVNGGVAALSGATIRGGRLAADGTSVIVASSGATLDGRSATLSLTGALPVANGQTLTLLGGINNGGTIACNQTACRITSAGSGSHDTGRTTSSCPAGCHGPTGPANLMRPRNRFLCSRHVRERNLVDKGEM